MAAREGSASVEHVRQPSRSSIVRPTSIACWRGWNAPSHVVDAARSASATGAGQPHRADVGRRRQLRSAITTSATSPLPKPGTMRQLLDLASLIACDPFDRTRPLWQFVVVDGLTRRQVGTDREAASHDHRRRGQREALAAVPRFRARRPRPSAARPGSSSTTARPHQPIRTVICFRDLLAGSLRMPLGLLRQIKDLLSDPTGIPDAGSAAADTVRGVMSQLGDTEQARSPLWTQRSLKRRMEVLRAPFGETRAAAKRLGGTLNTAFLTAAAEAAGRYHQRMGSPVEELRASMAISTRSRRFRLQRILPGADAGADRRHADRRAVHLDPGGRRCRTRVQRDGVARNTRRGCVDLADVADHPTGTPAGADGRLRDVQRSRCTGAAVRRRCGGAWRTMPSARWPAWPTT